MAANSRSCLHIMTYGMIEGDVDGIVGKLRCGLMLRERYLNGKRVWPSLVPVDWSIAGDAYNRHSPVAPPDDRCGTCLLLAGR
jgi:hypothetical protein